VNFTNSGSYGRGGYPPLSFNYRHPPRTSPRQPQNLLRPTAKGCTDCGPQPMGLGSVGVTGLSGLKAVGDAYAEGRIPTGVWIGYSVLATVSAAACGYHGYKRNNSIGWAVVWFLFGGWFPVITPVVAVAQGFGTKA
jgi:hypothetical protein